MNKIKMGVKPLLYPIPTVLVGANVDGKPNYCTVGNCGIMSLKPDALYVSSHIENITNKGIKQDKFFSINIPSVNLVERTDYCGLVSGAIVDKSRIFETFSPGGCTAPMIKECPVNIECKVIKEFSLFDMEVFIGEIVETYISEGCITDGVPDLKKINPIIYSIDETYWGIGEYIGKAFSVGLKYIEETK